MDLLLQSVREMVVEWICQDSVYEFLNQLKQAILLDFVNMGDLGL